MAAIAGSFNFENGDWPIAAGIMGSTMAGIQASRSTTELASAGIMAAAQIAAAEMQGDKNIELWQLARDWIMTVPQGQGTHNVYRDWSMGGQESTARAAYVTYIASHTRTFADMISIGNTNVANLQTAITESDDFINDLYDDVIRTERLAFNDTLRSEQLTDAGTDTANKRTSIVEINNFDEKLSQAKEGGIIMAYKEEFSRIHTEEAKKGYLGGDCFRDRRLSVARLKLQDDIAENFAGMYLRNTERLENLNIELSERDFQLSEGDRNRRFNIYEDDVNKKTGNTNLPSEKITQNNNVIGDAPEDLAHRSWLRRYDPSPLKLQHTPPSSTPTPEGESTGAVIAGALGNFASGALRRGFQSGQGFPAGVGSGYGNGTLNF
jgi:hypothetical protein